MKRRRGSTMSVIAVAFWAGVLIFVLWLISGYDPETSASFLTQ